MSTTKIALPTVEELFVSGAHFGHKKKHWHPKIKKYIHSTIKGVHIINLEKTVAQLENACEFLYKVAKSGKKIIFVGTKEQVKQILEVEAKGCGALYVTDRWYGGTLTNFENIRRNINKYIDNKDKLASNLLTNLTKKERLLIQRDVEKKAKSYEGLIGLTELPGAVLVIDAKRENTAVNECNLLKIPVVGICDTNTDPTKIKYPIPANDDAIKSLDIIVKALSRAVYLGYSETVKSTAEVKK